MSAIDTIAMNNMEMEARLRVLAEQRTALLEGMKDKLPDKFDPLKFDLQEERTLQPIEEKKTAAEEKPEIDKPVSHKRHVIPPVKFSPPARPSRMQGVDEIRKSDYDTLRGQRQLSPRSTSDTAAAPTAKPKGRLSSAKAKASPDKVSPLNKLSPGTALSTAKRSTSVQLGSSTRAGSNTRAANQGASTSQQNRAGRPASSSPTRNRAALFGQQDLSTPRGRTAKDYDVIKERRMGKSGASGQNLWK